MHVLDLPPRPLRPLSPPTAARTGSPGSTVPRGSGSGIGNSNAVLGVGATPLHEWILGTHTLGSMLGSAHGSTGLDDAFVRKGFENVGAWILGRNMFGPIRGAWPDDAWKGWWGDEPPYHTPVFVLTHHARAPLEMKGGTVFHFVTDGIEAALERARKAAGERDVRLGGGANTIRQYLRAGLVDELHLAIAPFLLGGGEPLMADLDLPALGYTVREHSASETTTHVVIERRA